MKNQLGRNFSGIASHRDEDEGKKKTSRQILFLKMVLGSQIASMAEKEIFSEEWANMRDPSGTC